MTLTFTTPRTAMEKELHEQEVRYNEALRMDAEFHVLKSIQQKIKQLRSLLSEQKLQAVNEF